MYAEGAEIENTSLVRPATETDPLLGDQEPVRKPFYRPRPLWLVPFAITAALVRGMTLAPRIEVFTQLSCAGLHGRNPQYNHTFITTTTIPPLSQPPDNLDHITPFYLSIDPLGPPLHPHDVRWSVPPRSNYTIVSSGVSTGDEDEDDPRNLPSNRCLTDPTVQAGAARLQTIMTTTMGLLSALTTGWWGHFGERHGRTKVLAITTFGLFLTDLTFILVSTPSSPFSSHGHKLLILAPIIEGALGGWSTLQSATQAYLSDCTSSGSRAQIFSRFAGVFYIGVSVGPSLGGYFIKHPLKIFGDPATNNGRLSVTCVFWVAIVCSFINFLLVLFVFPESLDKAKMLRALETQNGKGKARATDDTVVAESSTSSAEQHKGEEGVIRAFLKPLRLFMPIRVYDGVHVYGWGVEQLSYYISFMSASRATFLLIICPWIIAAFKPKPKPSAHGNTSAAGSKSTKPKPTRAHLTREISFDLVVMRCSLLVDVVSNLLVTLGPMPAIHARGASRMQSQVWFVLASGLSSMGSGATPALQSLALCIVQTRALDAAAEGEDRNSNDGGVGQLFGALAVMQTLGQMIVGPMLFGLVYSGTVGGFPKGVFVTAGGILVFALMLGLLVRAPVARGKKDRERGRSRVSKDLRGGAVVA
ncbi:hypothetical protein H0H92_011379 [Tricholoma furcatifolium]|nr:hypothetical protein H0H92_011379 [Tricholoma furcatifolium]